MGKIKKCKEKYNEKALDLYRQGTFIKEAARKYDIPVSTLKRRRNQELLLSGIKPKL